MRKNFKILFFGLIVFLLMILPVLYTFGRGLVPCGGEGEDPCTLCHFFVLIKRVIEFLSIDVAIPLVAIMGFVSAILFVTAHGNPQWITRARQTLTAAVIGFIIVLGSWVIVNTIVVIATGNSAGEVFGKPWYTIQCGSGKGGGGSGGSGSPDSGFSDSNERIFGQADFCRCKNNNLEGPPNNSLDCFRRETYTDEGGGEALFYIGSTYCAWYEVCYPHSAEKKNKCLSVSIPKCICVEEGKLGGLYKCLEGEGGNINLLKTSFCPRDKKCSGIANCEYSEGLAEPYCNMPCQ